MESWYFAYGSNLLKRQMIERIGSTGSSDPGPRLAYLANYRLVFQHLDNVSPAFANILTPGTGICGMVYRLRPADFQILDGYEAGYERHSVTVTDDNGDFLDAIAYVMKSSQQLAIGKPKAEYLRKIVDGATQHGIPASYIESIKSSAQLATL